MTNEEIYDLEIAPALRQIGERCRELGMSIVAQVEHEPGSCARTSWVAPGACFDQLLVDAASRASGNVDALVLAIMRHVREHAGGRGSGSMILSLLSGQAASDALVEASVELAELRELAPLVEVSRADDVHGWPRTQAHEEARRRVMELLRLGHGDAKIAPEGLDEEKRSTRP